MKNYTPIVDCEYGPLDPKVNLEPDFFTGFEPAKRQEIITMEAAFYRSLTAPYSVDAKLKKSYIDIMTRDGKVRVKVYRPKNTEGALPAFVFIHGGGFVTCSVETHDFVPTYIAANTNIIAFSIEYSLAPEHKFPKGINDCFDVLKWISENADALGVDPTRITVGGDSSGANFTIALTLMEKAYGSSMINKQVLIYPVTDMSNTIRKQSAEVYKLVGSMDEEGVALNAVFDNYTEPGTDSKDPLISPLLANDLSNLPEALFIEAECDALLDDGLIYAKCLQDAGVKVSFYIYKGMPHAFILRTYEETFDALEKICDFLR